MLFVFLIAMAAYIVAMIGFWRVILRVGGGAVNGAGLLLPGWVAALLHGWLLGVGMLPGNTLNLALGNVFSLVTLMTVVLFLLAALARDVRGLSLLVMPLGIAGLVVGQFLSGRPLLIQDAPPLLWWHLGVALFAFGILCIAAAQALVLIFQDRHLHSHRTGNLLPAMPAIQTMENNLFRLTQIGALLLTVNLIIGILFLRARYGYALEFNHHILLSFVAWLGFCALLAGHRIYGWRGEVAARWTLAAFTVLVLAYFGTRFVTTIILS